jgi:hypothetical protein
VLDEIVGFVIVYLKKKSFWKVTNWICFIFVGWIFYTQYKKKKKEKETANANASKSLFGKFLFAVHWFSLAGLVGRGDRPCKSSVSSTLAKMDLLGLVKP